MDIEKGRGSGSTDFGSHFRCVYRDREEQRRNRWGMRSEEFCLHVFSVRCPLDIPGEGVEFGVQGKLASFAPWFGEKLKEQTVEEK